MPQEKNNNKVTLAFEEGLTVIAGYPYGEEIYKKQAAGKLDIEQDFTVEIPEGIESVCSSFVRGFFAEIRSAIGKKKLLERLTIECHGELEPEAVKRKIK